MSDSGALASLVLPSPVGRLEVLADGTAITALRFLGSGEPRGAGRPGSPLLREAHAQLTAYFSGDPVTFDLPLRPGGTTFQRDVWDALRGIPWGHTTTYGELAGGLGLPPGSARAVGAAVGANPLPVLIACHRVIGADGTLTGYAGGLVRKTTLLRLEGVIEEAEATLF